MARITCKTDLLAAVLGGIIDPSSQVQDDGSVVWTAARNNTLFAPLLAHPVQLTAPNLPRQVWVLGRAVA